MALLKAAFVLAVLPAWATAQPQEDRQFKEAGVCARCHVISVVEWGMSRHRAAGTNCVACHGSSEGHVVDERNNVKPEKMPSGAAIAGLCADCHQACPKTRKTAACQDCHHVHALVNPNQPPTARDERLDAQSAQWKTYAKRMEEGESAARAGEWTRARSAFQQALEANPGDRTATDRLRVCDRRLAPGLPGFETGGGARDEQTGLPREVVVSGRGIAMALAPGGDVELGSEHFGASKPPHTVRVEPFYIGKYEVTEAEWQAVMGKNGRPEEARDPRAPAAGISWNDAQAFIRRLNENVPGGGFRLPTEAEWEFAARAGSLGDLSAVAWFGEAQSGAPRAVGAKKPDKLGLYDIRGNVWEWCSSLGMPYPYDPADGREAPEASGLRVLRGGGYADSADLLDPALRHFERPDRRLRWNGFRVARSVPEP
ncbi:MAG: SUMF1/EgtB/PvdO family nonheme iron enzyme [Bryobacteraceae bacterium]|nr:SUMF1/EgtB/PvdO family nonheme iron enzyme [Bryobacteraceae bacterium]